MLRAMRFEAVLSALLALLLAARQWWPAFRSLPSTGFGDWQMIHHHWEAQRIAVQRFGEWPVWDPFFCGGITIAGNPESQLYAPLFWLTFLIGSIAAAKLFLLLHAACALLGMYWLARAEYRLQPGAAAFAAVAWALSGWLAWDGSGGHATFLPFAFAPWIVLCFRRSERSPAFVVATAALLVLTLLEGGTYPFPYFVLLLALELGLKLAQRGSVRAVLRGAAQIAALTTLAGAIRLLPIALELSATPRAVASEDALGWRDVWLMLTARSHEWSFAPHPYVWPEYGSYVGYSVLALAAIGAAACVARRAPPHLLLGLLLFGLLMLGSPAPYFPWPLLHELPVYDSLRVPSRFAVLVTFYLALLAGHALALLLMRLPRRPALAVAGLAVAAQSADMLAVTAEIVDRWHEPPLSSAAPEPAFHVANDSRYGFALASYPQLNVGSLLCYAGAMNWQASPALWIGRSAQARVVRARGRVLSWGVTTRRVFAEVDLPKPARVVFNQNHAPGWTASTGELQEDRGRLAVDLPAGRRRIELVYAPPALGYAAALSALGLGLMLWLLWRARATLPPPPVLHPVASRAPADAAHPD